MTDKKNDDEIKPIADPVESIEDLRAEAESADMDAFETEPETAPDVEPDIEPDAEPDAQMGFDPEQLTQILGNAIGGLLDGYYAKIGARMITEKECYNIGKASEAVMDKYLPGLLKRFPELFALGFAIGMPTVLRVQELQFEKRAQAAKKVETPKPENSAEQPNQHSGLDPNA